DRPSEQNGTGIVPVAVGFNHFGACTGNKFAEVHLKTLIFTWLPARIRLFDVLDSEARLAAVDDVEGFSEAKVDLESDRVGGVGHGQFRHAQTKLVGLGVEVIEAVRGRGPGVEANSIVGV